MNLNELIALLNKYEQKYPVDEWEINGINIWPIIRKKIGLNFYQYIFKNVVAPKSASPVPKWIKPVHQLRAVIYYIQALIRLKFFVLSKKKNVLFCGTSEHRAFVDKLFCNRFFDSWIDLDEELKEQALFFEFDGLYHSRSRYNNRKILVDCDKLLYGLSLTSKLKERILVLLHISNRELPAKKTDRIDEFLEEVNTELLKFELSTISYDMIEKLILDIQYKAQLLKKIIKKINPKVVFFLCYHNIFSPLYAANELGIPTIDMQHGSAGTNDLMYGVWKNVPEKGYQLFPKYFWFWDQESKSSLRLTSNNNHEGLIGGNTWVELWQSDDYKTMFKDLKLKVLDKKIILYTLQPGGFDLNEAMVHLIKATSGDYNWWFRIHPRRFLEKAQTIEALRSAGILKLVEIEMASSYPLPYILKSCVLHLTKYSGAHIEAKLFNVPSIITDEIGKEAYDEDIEKGKAYYINEKHLFEEKSFILKLIQDGVGAKTHNLPATRETLQKFLE